MNKNTTAMDIHSFRFLVVACGLIAMIVLAVPVGLSLRRSRRSVRQAKMSRKA